MRLFWSLLLFFLIFTLPAQEAANGAALVPGGAAEPEIAAVVGPFPLALVLEELEFAKDRSLIWQPDWPVEIPPDAFIASGDWLSIIIDYGDYQHRLRQSNGRLLEFPVLVQGSMVQARLEYAQGTEQIKFIYLGDNTSVEFLNYFQDDPVLFRVLQDETYSFVLLDSVRPETRPGLIKESWFDPDGVFLEAHEYRYTPGFDRITEFKIYSVSDTSNKYFDSRFLVTAIHSSDNVFSVSYINDYLPRYWNRQLADAGTENFSFQWDMNGFLIYLMAEQASMEYGPVRTNSFFEYVLDEQGNWVERQEIFMIANNGLLVPVSGKTIRRIIEYEVVNE